MTPWTRARSARWTRRYLAVDSRRYAWWHERPSPRWRWLAFRVALWLAWRLRSPWWTNLAQTLCRPLWVGMGGTEGWGRAGEGPF